MHTYALRLLVKSQSGVRGEEKVAGMPPVPCFEGHFSLLGRFQRAPFGVKVAADVASVSRLSYPVSEPPTPIALDFSPHTTAAACQRYSLYFYLPDSHTQGWRKALPN